MPEAGAKPDNGEAKHRIGADDGEISEPRAWEISEPTTGNIGADKRGGVSTADIQVIIDEMKKIF